MTAENLSFRTLIPSDKPLMTALQDRVMAALPDPRWYFPAEDWEFDDWLRDGDALGCLDGGILCGFGVLSAAASREGHCYAGVLGHPTENTFDFHDVMVDLPYRRRGIHSAILRMFAEKAKALGGTAVYATVDPENGASRRNFERAGFQVQVIQPAYDGRPRVYYRLSLND